MSPDSAAAVDSPVDPRSVIRKVTWHVVPLLFVLYVVAYLDRVNVSFAKDQMQRRLGPAFTEGVYGFGSGIFFVGYLLLEIPGALLVEHWSARKWFARILFTWGLCSMAMALVRTPAQFYSVRFLLGLAEAGFFPGMIVYFTHWFPRGDRGRAFAGMVLAIPLCLALGARVSGTILQLRWLGLDGWQWVFVSEGLPAVLLGVAVPFLLTDRPRHARWLSVAEREWMEQTLEAERREAAAAGGVTLGRALRHPTVWLLALGMFATNAGGYGLTFWLPDAVRHFLEEGGGAADDSFGWLAVAFAFGLAGVWLSGQTADRTGQPKWTCVAAQVLTGLCLAGSVRPGQPWGVVFALLCMTEFFAHSWPSPFWVLPTLTLSASAAAVSIGFINVCGNFAGFVGPSVFGGLKDAGFTDRACLLFLAGCYAAGGVLIAMLPVAGLQKVPGPGDGSGDRPHDPGATGRAATTSEGGGPVNRTAPSDALLE